jgi:hypothetical protein
VIVFFVVVSVHRLRNVTIGFHRTICTRVQLFA